MESKNKLLAAFFCAFLLSGCDRCLTDACCTDNGNSQKITLRLSNEVINLSITTTNNVHVLRFHDQHQFLGEAIVRPTATSFEIQSSALKCDCHTTNLNGQKLEVCDWKYNGAQLYREEFNQTNKPASLKKISPLGTEIRCK